MYVCVCVGVKLWGQNQSQVSGPCTHSDYVLNVAMSGEKVVCLRKVQSLRCSECDLMVVC